MLQFCSSQNYCQVDAFLSHIYMLVFLTLCSVSFENKARQMPEKRTRLLSKHFSTAGKRL